MVDAFELEARVRALARSIDAPADAVPTFGWSRDFGYPHVEVNGDAMHWVVMERGVELERRTTTDLDELLYWVFQSTTFTMATAWELRHRDDTQDFRVGLFTRQFELLGKLSPTWVARRKAELGNILDEVGLVSQQEPCAVPQNAGMVGRSVDRHSGARRG